MLLLLAKKHPAAAVQLENTAAVLGSEAEQTDCLLSLWEATGNFNEVTNTSWNIPVGNTDLTLEIDIIEVLSIAYDDPPEECHSIFENDEFFLPLVLPMKTGSLDVLAMLDGEISLTDNDLFYDIVTPTEGYLSVASLSSGDIEMRNLVLREPGAVTLVVDSTAYVADKWNLALTAPATGTPNGSITTFPSGTVLFTMSVVYDDVLYRTSGTNISAFTLESASGDWLIDGLELIFVDNGPISNTTWSLSVSSTLEFSP